MSSELRFSESEANEILRTAVRAAAPGKISRDELAIAAAQLGISAQDLEAAEAKHERLKTEEGEQQEFRRLRLQSWKNRLYFFLLYCVVMQIPILLLGPEFSTVIAFCEGVILCGFVFVFTYGRHVWLSPRSRQYQQQYEEWRYLRRFNVTGDQRLGVVAQVVADQLRREDTTTLLKLRLGVKKSLRCDWIRAREAVDEYMERYPDLKAKVRGA